MDCNSQKAQESIGKFKRHLPPSIAVHFDTLTSPDIRRRDHVDLSSP